MMTLASGAGGRPLRRRREMPPLSPGNHLPEELGVRSRAGSLGVCIVVGRIGMFCGGGQVG
jgi:hypothetical protein